MPKNATPFVTYFYWSNLIRLPTIKVLKISTLKEFQYAIVSAIGFGAVLGSLSSGYLIDNYFTHNDVKDWHNIWLTFAIYAMVITVLFAIFFKHKHNLNNVESINH